MNKTLLKSIEVIQFSRVDEILLNMNKPCNKGLYVAKKDNLFYAFDTRKTNAFRSQYCKSKAEAEHWLISV